MGNQVAHYIVWGKVWPGFSVISKRISDLCVASGNVRQRNVAPFTAWGGRIPQHILERLEKIFTMWLRVSIIHLFLVSSVFPHW
jgi:hypothetical protein